MKRLNITPSMKDAIKRVNNGAEIDLSSIAVFESRSLNNKPLRKGGLFLGAITSDDTMNKMATLLNSSNEGRPLHIMHDRGLLNVGKVFSARVDKNSEGVTELSTLWYLPLSEDKLVSRIEAGAVDQVSISIFGEKLKCSECEFDWMSDEATMDHFVELTCKNGHTIGKDGVHVHIQGLDHWAEMSLVDRGGAQDARIVSPDESRFVDASEFFKLAANNQNNPKTNSLSVVRIATLLDKEPEMSLTKEDVEAIIAAKLTDGLKAKDEAHATELAAKAKEAADLKAEVETLKTGLAAAKAEAAKTPAADADAKITALTETNTKTMDFLKEEARKASVITGKALPTELNDLDQVKTFLSEAGVALVKNFAVEHRDTLAVAAKDTPNVNALAAFKAR